MTIDNDFSNNNMDLDDDVLYNFMDFFYELMRHVVITPWRGSRNNINILLRFD